MNNLYQLICVRRDNYNVVNGAMRNSLTEQFHTRMYTLNGQARFQLKRRIVPPKCVIRKVSTYFFARLLDADIIAQARHSERQALF